jgi:ABC-type nitrate/sulfonate/bicarbonate transport system permease component
VWLYVTSAVGLLGLWILSARYDVVPYLPSPWDVVLVFERHRSRLLSDAAYTFVRGMIGFLIGSAAGFVMAIVMGWNRYIRAFAAPLIVTGKAIPVLSLIPIFILWFGTGERSIVAFIALGCFFILFVVAYEAMTTVPRTYMWAAASLGSRPAAVYRRVVVPAITPTIVGGLRVAVTLAFPLALAAEFLGAQHGLGFFVIKATQQLQVADMIAGVIGIAVLAMIGDAGVRFASRHVTKWSEREEPAR